MRLDLFDADAEAGVSAKTAIAAALIGAGVTLAALLLAIGLGSRLGRSTQAMVTRFMGLIVASMGMHFVLTGLKAFLCA